MIMILEFRFDKINNLNVVTIMYHFLPKHTFL